MLRLKKISLTLIFIALAATLVFGAPNCARAAGGGADITAAINEMSLTPEAAIKETGVMIQKLEQLLNSKKIEPAARNHYIDILEIQSDKLTLVIDEVQAKLAKVNKYSSMLGQTQKTANEVFKRLSAYNPPAALKQKNETKPAHQAAKKSAVPVDETIKRIEEANTVLAEIDAAVKAAKIDSKNKTELLKGLKMQVENLNAFLKVSESKKTEITVSIKTLSDLKLKIDGFLKKMNAYNPQPATPVQNVPVKIKK